MYQLLPVLARGHLAGDLHTTVQLRSPTNWGTLPFLARKKVLTVKLQYLILYTVPSHVTDRVRSYRTASFGTSDCRDRCPVRRQTDGQVRPGRRNAAEARHGRSASFGTKKGFGETNRRRRPVRVLVVFFCVWFVCICFVFLKQNRT